MADTMLVRLKQPLNPKKGIKVQRYMFEGIRFEAEAGWYEVSMDLANKLKDLHQEHYDEDSPKLFDVTTADGAVRIEEADVARAEAQKRAAASKPHKVGHPIPRGSVRKPKSSTTMTTDDLDHPKPPGETEDDPEEDLEEDLGHETDSVEPKMIDPAPEGEDAAGEPDGRVHSVGRVTSAGNNPGSTPPHAPRPRQRGR